jgi:acyl-CoA oxidase
MKYWIGNLGRTCNKGVVFANLIIKGKNQGIHVFLIDIRDNKQNLKPGIELGDCGPKLGLNGIDNGWCLFKHFKVPYDCLLDKYS